MARPDRRVDADVGEVMVKRVLMIAYHFPPISASSGFQRTLRFSQYLPESGWMPSVLTVHPRAYPGHVADPPEANALPRDGHVRRAFALDTAKHLSLFGRYPQWLSTPDRWWSWQIGAVPAGLAMIRELKPDVLWSTFPIATRTCDRPYAAQAQWNSVGRRLSRSDGAGRLSARARATSRLPADRTEDGRELRSRSVHHPRYAGPLCRALSGLAGGAARRDRKRLRRSGVCGCRGREACGRRAAGKARRAAGARAQRDGVSVGTRTRVRSSKRCRTCARTGGSPPVRCRSCSVRQAATTTCADC